ncbi:NADH-quinone oxidoreductase subunit J [Buchnera aphidicola (Periphyllus koelreuteriae)]|uniref:NADH-quinone oxidoreductase subunit J n=1 Tax=Buchnera aphidicola TaxID=9 RepID=UPI0031B80DB3
MNILFYIFSIISIISTILVIFQNNPIYSLLYLILSFLSFSGIYFSINTLFIGSLETIIYAGAIMVLFIFAIMVLNLGSITINQEKKYFSKFKIIISIFLSIFIFFIFFIYFYKIKNGIININFFDIKSIGIVLFKKYILFMESLSMLLLSALIIVFHLFINNKYIKKK